MSDQEEYKNGHCREPKKKPDIGRDDVEDLIEFGDSDTEEEIEEESEELPVSDGMQVVLEASQLLPQNYSSDEIEEEVPGDFPEVLYEFDPENQGDPESLEEQVVVVEQQVLDVTGVLIEMVEELSENELLEEWQVQVEISCDEAEQESPQQSLMGLGNPSNQGQEDPAESSEPSSADSANERRVSSASDSSAIDQDSNTDGHHGPNYQGLDVEPSEQDLNQQGGNNGSSSLRQGANVEHLEGPSESVQGSSDQVRNGGSSISDQGLNNETRNCRGPAVDRNLNGRSATSVQGLKDGPSASGQDLVDQDTGVESRSDQGVLVQNPNEQSRSSHEYNAESSSIAKVLNNSEILNGGPSRSDKDSIEKIREDVGACVCEEVMEQLELMEVNVEAHPIQDIGIERQPDLEQDIWLRDQIVEVLDAAENVDLNGGPHSGPDPGVHRVRVRRTAAANEVLVEPAVLGRPADHVEEAPNENQDVLLDEHLVEEQAEGGQILPGPLEEIGGQDNVASEADTAAEAQKTE